MSRLAQWAAVAGAAAALAAAPAFLDEYGLQIGFRMLLYASLGEAWNLLAGYGGLVSLGSASFVGIGAYVLVGLLNGAEPSIPLALLTGGAAAAAAAALVAPAVFRLRGLYFTVGTLALGEALRLLMVNVPYFGGASGLVSRIDPPEIAGLYAWALGLFAVTTLAMSAVTATRFSILLRAVRDDEDAAAQIGVRAFRIKLAAFLLASFLMGAAGGLQGLKLGAIEPYGAFGLQWSVDVLALVIIGGVGMRFGAIVGAVFSVALGELLADTPELHVAITGLILIVVVRYAPRGLCGLAVSLAAARRPAGGLAMATRP